MFLFCHWPSSCASTRLFCVKPRDGRRAVALLTLRARKRGSGVGRWFPCPLRSLRSLPPCSALRCQASRRSAGGRTAHSACAETRLGRWPLVSLPAAFTALPAALLGSSMSSLVTVGGRSHCSLRVRGNAARALAASFLARCVHCAPCRPARLCYLWFSPSH